MNRSSRIDPTWVYRPNWRERESLAAATWFAVAALMLPLSVITVWGLVVDDRMMGSQSVWAKPTKFQLSLAMHFATLSLVATRLSPSVRASTFLLAVAMVSSVAALAEIGYIFVQAARQQPSHFNVSTPFHAAMFSLMASGAVILTSAAAAVAILVARDDAVRMGKATRLAVVLGLLLGTGLTLVTAFRLGANMGHHVGSAPAGGASLPITGWSLVVGDLRVPHFLATHMMQVIPIAGLVADRWLPPRRAVRVVLALAGGWTVLVITQFLRALEGLPFAQLAV